MSLIVGARQYVVGLGEITRRTRERANFPTMASSPHEHIGLMIHS